MESHEKTEKAELTYKLKHLFCHDPDCQDCSKGKGHGPFWHAIIDFGDYKKTVFLGKDFRPLEFEKEPNEGKESQQQSDNGNKSQDKINSAENRFDFDSKELFPKNEQDIKQNPGKQHQFIPTKLDFERDLRTLKTTLRATNLKLVYRKLTKKYHPDNYPGVDYVNAWMAEINGQYCQLKKSARF
ncbi:hypothetical protein KJ966_16665 [bacterium]|nr:hypothetical protein [bacterium]